MTTHLICHYEQQFRTYIMQALVGEKAADLKALLQQLIKDNESDYKAINYAYLNVKKELVG